MGIAEILQTIEIAIALSALSWASAVFFLGRASREKEKEFRYKSFLHFLVSLVVVIVCAVAIMPLFASLLFHHALTGCPRLSVIFLAIAWLLLCLSSIIWIVGLFRTYSTRGNSYEDDRNREPKGRSE